MQQNNGIEDNKSIPKACLVHAYTRLERSCRYKEHLLAKGRGRYASINCSTAVTSSLSLLRCVHIEQGATTLYRATLGASC